MTYPIPEDVEILEEYPVDESQTVSNAGDAVLFKNPQDDLYECVIWNERALDHQAGEWTIRQLN